MWETMWSPPSWLWPLSWSEMVTPPSSTSPRSSSSNDDAGEAAAAAVTTTTTIAATTGEATTMQQKSTSSRSDHHGDSADDTFGIAWENAIEKLLETPIGATEFGGQELDQNSNHQENKKGNDVNATCLHHVRQLDSWDCGVACLLMVWEWQSSHIDRHHHQQKQHDVDIDDEYRRQRDAARREWILEKIATRSVWTADIVYILDLMMHNPPHLQPPQSTMVVQMVNILFCSNILQVNESLHGIEYYTKNFEQDRHRVRHRFDVIRERGIPLLQHPPKRSKSTAVGGLPLAQVVRLIEQPDCIAIALVDNSILTCGGKAALASVGDQHPAVAAVAPYTGHFIILTGTSRDAKHLKQASTTSSATSTSSNTARSNDDDYCFVAYNPGVDETISYICPSLLERAWRAEGTDEDIIFLYKTTLVAVP